MNPFGRRGFAVVLISMGLIATFATRPSTPPKIPRISNARHWPGIRVRTQRIVSTPSRIVASGSLTQSLSAMVRS